MIRFFKNIAFLAIILSFLFPAFSFAAKEYKETTQSDLTRDMELYLEKSVFVDGTFLFTGSDFCYQIQKTKINTREYFCFALGPVNLIRFYLKKNHLQVPELMGMKKGSTIRAYGTFDAIGRDYKYIVVDHFEIIDPANPPKVPAPAPAVAPAAPAPAPATPAPQKTK